MRLSWYLSLALWAGLAPFSGAVETRQAPVRLAPLDVRDAALALPPRDFDAGLKTVAPGYFPAPLAHLAEPMLGEPLAAAPAGALRALADSPIAKAILRPGADPAPAIDGLFDGTLTRVALLDGPMEAIDARAGMVDDAKHSVYAGYYRFHTDAAGLYKLAMLRRAARKGRDVRLLLDPWGSGIPKAMQRHLVDEGVKIRFYHPPNIGRLSWLWRRSHDKWTIADGQAAILGDRNMGKHYFGMGEAPWVSREVYAEGKVARQSADYAERLWDSKEVEAARGLEKASLKDIAKWSAKLDTFETHFERRKERGETALKPWAARTRTIADANFSHNYFGPRRSVSGTGLDLLRLIRSAEKTIVIENAYIVLPQIFKLELQRAIRRGVRVVMLTNSLKTNNLFSAKSAYEADVPMLISMGIELWEFQGPGTLHAKVMVVDGQRSYLGSFNLDPRSLKLNTETGIVANDADLARDMLFQIRRTQANSVLVGYQREMLVPRRMLPILGKLWALWRALLLIFLRDQV